MALQDEYPTLYYHQVPGPALDTMVQVRGQYIGLAQTLYDTLPPGRPRSLAFTALEDSLMRAIQALAIEHGTIP